MDQKQREDLAQQIRTARAKHGWSQAELAERAGVAPNTIIGIESGTRGTQAGKLRAVLDALEIQPAIDEVRRTLPADIDLVTQVVTMWLMGMPEGEQRAAAVLELVRFMATPAGEKPSK